MVTPFGVSQDYVIIDVISLRNKLLIATNHRTNTATSKLFLLDPYAPGLLYTFDDIYETNLYNIQTLKLVEGEVKVISGNVDYTINNWTGGDYVIPSRKIPVDTTSALNINRQAVDVKRNTMYFGTNNSVSGMRAGIYTYGRDTDQDPWCISNEHINESADVSSVDYRAIKWWHYAGDEVLFANWYDGTNYNASRLTTTKADGVFETVWFRPYPGHKSQILDMTVFTQSIPASCSYVISHMIDGQASPGTTIATVSTLDTVKAVIRNNKTIVSTYKTSDGTSSDVISTPTAAWRKGYKHKIRIAYTSSTTTAVEIEKIKLYVRKQENVN